MPLLAEALTSGARCSDISLDLSVLGDALMPSSVTACRPARVTDPEILARIEAAFTLAVYRASRRAALQRLGLLPPPPPDLRALKLLLRVRQPPAAPPPPEE